MKVRLIKRKSIEDFVYENARARSSFRIWLSLLRHADWEEPLDISNTYGSVDFLGKGTNRVVFDVAGNEFRMICKYHFGNRMVHLYIKWIGTHAEYSRLCKNMGQYTVGKY